MNPAITGNDILIYIQIALSLLGFVGLYLKLNDKFEKGKTEHGERIARIETHLIHLMRKLNMAPRSVPDADEYMDKTL